MVLQILSYGSSVWYANVGNMKKLERVQKISTKWILNRSDLHYVARLKKLKNLPLRFYLEVLDVLLMSKILNGQNSIDWKNYIFLQPNSRRPFRLMQTRYEKCKFNFFFHTCRLLNKMREKIDFFNTDDLKRRTLKIYYEHFETHYNENHSCSWNILCLCSICKQLPSEKLMIMKLFVFVYVYKEKILQVLIYIHKIYMF